MAIAKCDHFSHLVTAALEMWPYSPPSIDEKSWCVGAETGSCHPNEDNGSRNRYMRKWRRGAERRAVSFLTPMVNTFRHQDASYTWHKQSRFYVFDLPAQGLVSAHTELRAEYRTALNTGMCPRVLEVSAPHRDMRLQNMQASRWRPTHAGIGQCAYGRLYRLRAEYGKNDAWHRSSRIRSIGNSQRERPLCVA